MGAGTREADRLAEQQNEGPFLVLFDVGGGVGAGMFMSPTLVDTLEDVQAHVESAEKASDGNVTVRSIKLSKVLMATEMVNVLKRVPPYLELLSRLTRKDDMPLMHDSIRKCGEDVRKTLRLAGEKV